MGLFDFLRQPDINRGIREFHSVPGAVLLDVRTAEEYREGHIPGSKNLPLQAIDKAAEFINNKDIPVYLYCHSGARSSRASAALQRMGYGNINNIGGIAAYSGKVEK